MTTRLPFVLNPGSCLWLEEPENRRLLERLIKAEHAVGKFGTITITYNQGHPDKMIAEATVQEKY